MRNIFDENLIKRANGVLLDRKIVQEYEIGTPESYWGYITTYKGYISSFGAAVLQAGVARAVRNFKNSSVEGKWNVLKCIAVVLSKNEGESDDVNIPELIEKLEKKEIREVLEATSALKYALRLYKAKKEESIKKREKKSDSTGTDTTSSKEEEQLLPPEFTLCVKGNYGSELQSYFESTSGIRSFCSFTLATTYPGMLVGGAWGNEEESDAVKAVNNALQVDALTGYPIIAGSSIKGVLRSYFPTGREEDREDDRDKVEYLLHLLQQVEHDESIIPYLGIDHEKPLQDVTNTVQFDPLIEKFLKLRDLLFNENNIYFDAHLIGSKHGENEKVFAVDYITPHLKKLENPIPILIKKVVGGLSFGFNFRIKEYALTVDENKYILTVDLQKQLFKALLIDHGVGGKTNLGYGRLEEVIEI